MSGLLSQMMCTLMTSETPVDIFNSAAEDAASDVKLFSLPSCYIPLVNFVTKFHILCFVYMYLLLLLYT